MNEERLPRIRLVVAPLMEVFIGKGVSRDSVTRGERSRTAKSS